MTTDPGFLLGTCDWGPTRGEALRHPIEDARWHTFAGGGSGSGKTVSLKALFESYLCRGSAGLAFDVQGDLTAMALSLAHPSLSKIIPTSLLEPPPWMQDKDIQPGRKIAERLLQVIHPRILTPLSDAGERLALSPLASRPKAYDDLLASRGRDDDEAGDALTVQADMMAGDFLRRLGLLKARSTGPDALRGATTEFILSLWSKDTMLDGTEGLRNLASELREFDHPRIPESLLATMQEKISEQIPALQLGAEARWNMGVPLNFDDLMTAPPGKVPLVIVNLDPSNVPPEHHPLVVGRIMHAAFNWAAAQGPIPKFPRLAVLLDEIASEGGYNALIQPLTVRNHPSADAIRRGLRKARHWGTALLLGSQNPRDIDSKNFGNIRTRLIGNLSLKADIETMLAGVNLSSDRMKSIAENIKKTPSGQMFYVGSGGMDSKEGRTIERYRLRMLGHPHLKLSFEQIARIYELGIASKKSEQSGVGRKDPSSVRNDLRSLVSKHGRSLSPGLVAAIQNEIGILSRLPG